MNELVAEEIAAVHDLRLKRIYKYISRMPSLSTTVSKVLEICNHPATSPNDLNRVIALDPVLTAQVLRLINSAYYALPQKVNSLTRAIIILGINTVKNLTLSTAIIKNLGFGSNTRNLSMDEFWTHSIAVGVTAKAIAELIHIPKSDLEELFIAGLLHDIGKIPLSHRFPEEYTATLALCHSEQIPLLAAEKKVLEFDHCFVGNLIAQKWNLSPVFQEVLNLHHQPEAAQPEFQRFVSIITLADLYVNSRQIGFAGNPFPDKTMMKRLLSNHHLSMTALLDLQEKIETKIEDSRAFIQITR